MILALQRSMVRYFVVLLLGLSASWSVLAQNPHEAYWTKYAGMPSLDIRISLDGKPVRGLFESAQSRRKGIKIPLDDLLIAVTAGQHISFTVEISPRDANQWTDVSQNKNLVMTNPTGGVDVDKRSKQINITGDIRNPRNNFGYGSISIYYSNKDTKDEQFGFTVLHFDIKGKP